MIPALPSAARTLYGILFTIGATYAYR
jgi:hypothetical protein